MHTVFIGAGSNVGDRDNFLRKGISLLNASAAITVRRISSVYETEPLGEDASGAFLNLVIQAETSLTPDSLFHTLKAIEAAAGRISRTKWGDRELDLDLLLYDDECLAAPGLSIPHPEITSRDFVLVPLVELAPQLTHPATKQPFANYLEQLKDRFILRVWNSDLQPQ
jgi:2-amino-4-hydroxy-6-hydroxymethyldihydropteridine diphosphokinase